MDRLPAFEQLANPPFPKENDVPFDKAEIGKQQQVYDGTSNSWVVGKVRSQGGDGNVLNLRDVAQRWRRGPWAREPRQPGTLGALSVHRGYARIVIPPVELATRERAKVQAVKDIMGQRGLPNEMDTGPLGNILGMAGIKAPPKGARRKTQRRRKSTKRRFSTSLS